jgi:hypothetical protein
MTDIIGTERVFSDFVVVVVDEVVMSEVSFVFVAGLVSGELMLGTFSGIFSLLLSEFFSRFCSLLLSGFFSGFLSEFFFGEALRISLGVFSESFFFPPTTKYQIHGIQSHTPA